MGKWTANDIPDQTGKTIVITGANSGLGLRSAEALAAKGARVLMACRNAAKAATALESVKAKATGASPEVRALDLGSLASVRECAAGLAGELDSLDVLMNNAGIMAVPKSKTVDGFESQLGTNHLGHYALTGLLLPTLLKAAEPRVVTVSSQGHRMGKIDFDDLSWEKRRYSRWLAYGQTKLANLLFTSELQRQAVEHHTTLTAAAAHPGYASTNLTSGPAQGSSIMGPLTSLGDKLLGQSDAMGALPQLYAATMPDVGPNDYFGPDGFQEQRGHPKRVGRSSKALNDADATRLWARSEEMTGGVVPLVGLMLEMREVCERCEAPLGEVDAARICSFECTFCPACADVMDGTCPNCQGELLARPRRAAKSEL